MEQYVDLTIDHEIENNLYICSFLQHFVFISRRRYTIFCENSRKFSKIKVLKLINNVTAKPEDVVIECSGDKIKFVIELLNDSDLFYSPMENFMLLKCE